MAIRTIDQTTDQFATITPTVSRRDTTPSTIKRKGTNMKIYYTY